MTAAIHDVLPAFLEHVVIPFLREYTHGLKDQSFFGRWNTCYMSFFRLSQHVWGRMFYSLVKALAVRGSSRSAVAKAPV